MTGHDERERERDGRHGARAERGAARREALRQHGDGPHAERRDDREPDQPVAHVVVVHVAELVGDDEPRLGRREVLHERVVEHDALGRARGRSRTRWRRSCGARRPSRRPRRRRRPPRAASASTSERSSPRGSGLKSLNSGSSTTGPAYVVIDAEGDHDGGARQPPAAPEPPHARRRAAPRRAAANTAPIACDLATSPRLADPALGDQPDVLGALARDGGQRQRGEAGRRPRSPRRPRRRRARAAASRSEPLGRAAHDQHQHAEPDRGLREVDPQLAGAEGLGLLDLRRAEVGSRARPGAARARGRAGASGARRPRRRPPR